MATASLKTSQITFEHTCQNKRPALFIGCRIRSFVALEALGKLESDYPAKFLRRQQDVLGCLIGAGDCRYTYDLRIISRPDPEIYTRGKIDVVLLCRMDGFSAEQAEVHGRQLFDLLRSSFSAYDFDLVPAGDIPISSNLSNSAISPAYSVASVGILWNRSAARQYTRTLRASWRLSLPPPPKGLLPACFTFIHISQRSAISTTYSTSCFSNLLL